MDIAGGSLHLASLPWSDVPLGSLLDGHLLWNLALTTPGTARSCLFGEGFERSSSL